jgi:hypothetical protein
MGDVGWGEEASKPLITPSPFHLITSSSIGRAAEEFHQRSVELIGFFHLRDVAALFDDQ